MKKALGLSALLLVLCVLLAACGDGADDTPIWVAPTEPTETEADRGELVILFTGDLQNVYVYDRAQAHIGYAALAEYRQTLEDAKSEVVLLDGGDALALGGVTASDGGEALLELIEAVGYDYRVPGNAELRFDEELLNELTATYLCCNLVDTRTGETVFDAYAMAEFNGVKIAFVGITTPAVSAPNKFYDLCAGDDGQALYDAVQGAIDAAYDEGADFVIAIGHLGTDPNDVPWTASEVIANTTGLQLFLDCHSGAVIEGTTVVDMDGYEVPLCAVGSEFNYVGQVTLDLNNGAAEVLLIEELTGESNAIRLMAEELAQEPEETTVPPTEATE